MKKSKIIIFATIFFVLSILGEFKLSWIKNNDGDSTSGFSNITYTWNYGVVNPEYIDDPITLFYSDDTTFPSDSSYTFYASIVSYKSYLYLTGTKGPTPVTSRIYENSDYSGNGPLSKDALEQCGWLGFWLDDGKFGEQDINYPQFFGYGEVDHSIATFYQDLGYDIKQGETSQGPDKNKIPFENDFWRLSVNSACTTNTKYNTGYTVWLRVVPQMSKWSRNLYECKDGEHVWLHIG